MVQLEPGHVAACMSVLVLAVLVGSGFFSNDIVPSRHTIAERTNLDKRSVRESASAQPEGGEGKHSVADPTSIPTIDSDQNNDDEGVWVSDNDYCELSAGGDVTEATTVAQVLKVVNRCTSLEHVPLRMDAIMHVSLKLKVPVDVTELILDETFRILEEYGSECLLLIRSDAKKSCVKQVNKMVKDFRELHVNFRVHVAQEMLSNGNPFGAFKSVREALEKYPLSKDLRAGIGHCLDALEEFPVEGSGNLRAAKVFQHRAANIPSFTASVKQKFDIDATVLEPSINLTVFENFLSRDYIHRLVGTESNYTEAPLWCFHTKARLDATLPALLGIYGFDIPTHLPELKGKTWNNIPEKMLTGPQKQCLKPTVSKKLSELLAGKNAYSSSISVFEDEHPWIRDIAKHVENVTGLLDTHGSDWMITRYGPGATYAPHRDCDDTSDFKLDRIATVLIYLSTHETGGATRFTDVGVSVQPRAGRAAVWRNLDENNKCILSTQHEAMALPADTGETKIILQRWYHAEATNLLGLPYEPPEIATYVPKQPVIVCDGATECRMYNLWTSY